MDPERLGAGDSGRQCHPQSGGADGHTDAVPHLSSSPPQPPQGAWSGPRRAPPRGGSAHNARPRAPPPPAPRPGPAAHAAPPPPGPTRGAAPGGIARPRPAAEPRRGPSRPVRVHISRPRCGQVQRPVPRGSAAPSRLRTGLRRCLPGGHPCRCLTSCGPRRIPARARGPAAPGGERRRCRCCAVRSARGFYRIGLVVTGISAHS